VRDSKKGISTMRRMNRIIGVLTIAGLLAGCNTNANYPELSGAEIATESPNREAIERCTVLAVRWVADRYPPRNDRINASTAKEAADITVRWPMVLSLPVGTRRYYYERIVKGCGPEVVAMSPEAEKSGAPVYYVGRVWVRAHEATVDVYRPMPEIGESPTGGLVYQLITVRMSGGFQPWRVMNGRAWEPGAYPLPEKYNIPAKDRPDQYEYEMSLRRNAR
jgi:hypothetical protein